MVYMIYFDHSRLKILCLVRLLRFEFSKVKHFLTFIHAFGGYRFPNRIDPDWTAPQSSPTASTHSSYNMNKLMKKAMFLLHSKIRTLVNFHPRRIICLRNLKISKLFV